MYAVLATVFPIKRAGLQDDTDIYGTFSEEVAEQKGMQPFLGNKAASLEVVEAPEEAVDMDRVAGADFKKGSVVMTSV